MLGRGKVPILGKQRWQRQFGLPGNRSIVGTVGSGFMAVAHESLATIHDEDPGHLQTIAVELPDAVLIEHARAKTSRPYFGAKQLPQRPAAKAKLSV